ncbi:MAG: lysophospholipid acyltransferase family protein [Lentisphaeria bacterium]|nr:lysophospholipid acyltransferase family protein [Lentisphaeria bacterium]
MSRTDHAPNLSATRGSALGIWFFRVLIKCGAYQIALLLAHCVAFCYACFDRQAFAAARGYLEQRFPADKTSACKMRRHFYRLVAALACNLCSAFALACGRKIAVEEHNKPEFDGGMVIVLAHFGCWQVSMPLLQTPGHEAYIMARPDKNGNLDKFLALGGGNDLHVIDTEGFSGGLVEAAAVLDNGGTVIIMGDRAVDAAGSAKVPFLAGELELPLSPWMLAARSQKPVVVLFVDWENEKRQKIILDYDTSIAVPAIGDRRIRPADVQTMLVAYAARLEERCRKAPYSFFRFGNEKTTINPPEKL